ncbi:Leukocyte receptor cluster member like [Heracleum sosnowskyi]|uniref:Leukocyte receptor cluster member like n=1 Tax=Heracleum sosnowskyi TaxID=360622 RepID=A0AAD8HCP4_9APIA|nr:Leukocyte receptor cluster member like [Heracleum sosnowskyi]
MQSPCIHICNTLNPSNSHFLGHKFSPSLLNFTPIRHAYRCVSCSLDNNWSPGGRNCRERLKARGKDNVWSVDIETDKERDGRSRKKKRERRVRKVGKRSEKSGGRVMVSGSVLMEVETVLQTQEPVIRPAWNTFSSSLNGIWKGVGAIFSPITAEMEPIDVGKRGEHLFDCYTLCHIETVSCPSAEQISQIKRRVNWVTLNPHGENQQLKGTEHRSKEKYVREDNSLSPKKVYDANTGNHILPKYESFNFDKSDVMEDDVMSMEPGLVFFEDGSYSRGPVNIPVGEVNESDYFQSPTFKFEQCLVKGCHKRLRIVHTIEFSNGGSDIQIMRVAVYEEEWDSPVNLPDLSAIEFDLKPFSQRKRVQPSQLVGSWKVFEVSATPIYGEELMAEETEGTIPYVYLCTETLKKRNLPDNPVYFGEEEVLDMADVTVLWLPGGITSYVDVNKDGVLCIGVGWYSDEGINLVMERDYGLDGKLKEIRTKSEVKRRWPE